MPRELHYMPPDMHTLGLWKSGTRRSDQLGLEGVCSFPAVDQAAPDVAAPLVSSDKSRTKKRQRTSSAGLDTTYALTKRPRTDAYGGLLSPSSAPPDDADAVTASRRSVLPSLTSMAHLKGLLRQQFDLEVLMKHDELRVIDQELAKCQVALEQLRRCHLIPFPLDCPTPEQMLNTSGGQGPALEARTPGRVPRWAPPFGVVEGPYARHYAKWLIPDPLFDGVATNVLSATDTRPANAGMPEGRVTRNSVLSDASASAKRSARGVPGQRLQALPSGYPQPKEKQGPCIVRRTADGRIVKLLCPDCNRWDFSSTQGFINHCRIAHRRDFKSHAEAAVHCGQPIGMEEAGLVPGDSRSIVTSTSLGLPRVHPLARSQDEQTCSALLSRIHESLALYHTRPWPVVQEPRGALPQRAATLPKPCSPPSRFQASPSTPYLSQHLQRIRFDGDLEGQVRDAKTLDEVFDDCDEADASDKEESMSPKRPPSGTARTPAVMRVLSRSNTERSSLEYLSRFPGSRRLDIDPAHLESDNTLGDEVDGQSFDREPSIELSPHTFASNTAPSLVSDDGDYDESDDGSRSETSDVLDAMSDSDVAEITIDDDNDTPRPTRHCRPSIVTAIKLKKDEAEHVAFVTSLSHNTANVRRKHKAL